MSKKGRQRRTPEERIIARITRSRFAEAVRKDDMNKFYDWIRRMGGRP